MVLILDEGWGQTLVLARALADAGHRVTVLTANGSAAEYLRGDVRWQCGPARPSPALWPVIDRLARDAEHVLPMTEALLFHIWDAAPAWLARVHPRVAPAQRALLRDKHAMLAHVAAHGIEVPRQAPLDAAPALPVVVKACTGAGGARVRIVETAPQLADATRWARDLGGTWTAQELIDGPTCLVGGLFHAGRPLRLYAGEKLEQHPARTGPAVRLRSLADPALLALGCRVMQLLGWTGFASIDAVRNSDGRYVFLELNPRLWGSVGAARTAGVDLFAPFAALLAGGIPPADLAFAADLEHRVFPRYLLAPRYRSPRGLAYAVRDLLGDAGRDWRDLRLLRHLVRYVLRMPDQATRYAS